MAKSRSRARQWAALTWNFSVVLLQMTPAFLIWLLSAGAIGIDFREWNGTDEGMGWPVMTIPGWSKHELSWVMQKRFLLETE